MGAIKHNGYTFEPEFSVVSQTVPFMFIMEKNLLKKSDSNLMVTIPSMI